MENKTLEDLRNIIRDFVAEDDFEKMHFEDVERNTLALAKMRNLDLEIAFLIACLHDIARIKYGFKGKKHAKKGKKEAERMLEELFFDKEIIRIVATAIENHRRKNRIDDVYSELIKDADCLSHNAEFGGNINEVEKLRCKMISKGECLLLGIDGKSAVEILLEEWEALERHLERAVSGDADAELVHETRIRIRKIRAILKTMKSKTIKPFEENLKELFEKYSDLRECHVLRLHVIKIGKLDWLEKRIENIHEDMLAELVRDVRGLTENNKIKKMKKRLLNILENANLQIIGSENVMMKYGDSVRLAEIDDVESLHRMRIRGKTVKYLIELGIFIMDMECLRLVQDMHSEIGRLHDINVNRSLFKEIRYVGKDKLSAKETKRVKEYFDKMEGKTSINIEKGLFELKLRFRRNKK
ncbi:MAG: CHAD domain-containing protein [Peptostreptococcaceae bacterium]|nr:CHAD domain-containing protein [Peptostreptococcaceae bacterium]